MILELRTRRALYDQLDSNNQGNEIEGKEIISGTDIQKDMYNCIDGEDNTYKAIHTYLKQNNYVRIDYKEFHQLSYVHKRDLKRGDILVFKSMGNRVSAFRGWSYYKKK